MSQESKKPIEAVVLFDWDNTVTYSQEGKECFFPGSMELLRLLQSQNIKYGFVTHSYFFQGDKRKEAIDQFLASHGVVPNAFVDMSCVSYKIYNGCIVKPNVSNEEINKLHCDLIRKHGKGSNAFMGKLALEQMLFPEERWKNIYVIMVGDKAPDLWLPYFMMRDLGIGSTAILNMCALYHSMSPAEQTALQVVEQHHGTCRLPVVKVYNYEEIRVAIMRQIIDLTEKIISNDPTYIEYSNKTDYEMKTEPVQINIGTDRVLLTESGQEVYRKYINERLENHFINDLQKTRAAVSVENDVVEIVSEEFVPEMVVKDKSANVKAGWRQTILHPVKSVEENCLLM